MRRGIKQQRVKETKHIKKQLEKKNEVEENIRRWKNWKKDKKLKFKKSENRYETAKSQGNEAHKKEDTKRKYNKRKYGKMKQLKIHTGKIKKRKKYKTNKGQGNERYSKVDKTLDKTQIKHIR